MKYLIFILVCLLIENCNSQFTNTGFPNKVLSLDSPWNTVIGSNPSIDPQSVPMINKVKEALTSQQYSVSLALHYARFTFPIHNVDTSTTVNRITIYNPNGDGYHNSVDPNNTNKVLNLPVLTTFNPDPEADGHMIVFDTNLKVFHEFSRFKWINSSTASATRYDTFLYNDSGTHYPMEQSTRWWNYAIRGAGSKGIAGLIRYDEIERNELDHALAFGGPVNRMKSLASSSWNIELCSPVSARSDGWYNGTDTIMEGQRIQLNPSYDISKLGSKSKLIAQALQKYGGYMVDNSGDFCIYFENKGPSATSPWVTNYGTDFNSLAGIPLDEFRILTCDTIVTGVSKPPTSTSTSTSSTSSNPTSTTSTSSNPTSTSSNPTTSTTSTTSTSSNPTSTTSSTSSQPTSTTSTTSSTTETNTQEPTTSTDTPSIASHVHISLSFVIILFISIIVQ